MSDQKPALLGIKRDTDHDTFTAVFALPNGAGAISIPVPRDTTEEHMLEVARDHLHRLMQEVAAATADWVVPDDRRQEIDPTRTQPQRRRPDRPSTGGSWMGG